MEEGANEDKAEEEEEEPEQDFRDEFDEPVPFSESDEAPKVSSG